MNGRNFLAMLKLFNFVKSN